MAELRIHDQSSEYFKSLKSAGTDVNVDLDLPSKSGLILTETELHRLLDRESRVAAETIYKPDIEQTPIDENSFAGPIPIAPYLTSPTFLGPHEGTEWISSSTENFSGITDGSNDKIFKDSWYPDLHNANEQAYVKYRFRSGNIVSPWSDTVKFKAADKGIITPTIDIIENGLLPTIKISELQHYGTFTDLQHMSTSWIIEDEDERVVLSKLNDTINRTELEIEDDVLDPRKVYKIYVTQHTNQTERPFDKSKTAIGRYKTPKAKIAKPTLTFDNGIQPVIRGSSYNGVGSHMASEWKIYNSLGALFAEFNYDTTNLTTFPMDDFISQGREYRVEVRYINEDTKSPRGKVTFTLPAPNLSGGSNAYGGMEINPTLADRGLSIKLATFNSPTREDIQYTRWQLKFKITDSTTTDVRNVIQTYTDTSEAMEATWNQEMLYNYTPTQSYLAWLGGSTEINPILEISGYAVRMGLKTEKRYSSINVTKRFEYNLGTPTYEDSNTLSPLLKLSDPTGNDVSWLGYVNTSFSLFKKTGLDGNGLPIWTHISTNTSTNKQMRLSNLDNDTDYKVDAIVKANIFRFKKSYEFRSASYTMAAPTVAINQESGTWGITASGYSLTNYTGPNASHDSTTYVVINKNTGEKVWEQVKTQTDKLHILIPKTSLVADTTYEVRVTFHNGGNINSPVTTQEFTTPTTMP